MFILYSLLYFIMILLVQSLPTPDISINLDSNMNFSTSGNSSAVIGVEIAVENLIQPPAKSSASPIGGAQGGLSSVTLKPLTSSRPITMSSGSAVPPIFPPVATSASSFT
ncbi:hypothetical protein B0H14DRAFT_2891314 [Mycena olivaceomarginata]|nr:hypothetical protein B0H14DRAFT_2891314 [Mycena olivaceomarginata]